MNRTHHQMHVRLPPALKSLLEESATRNQRSLNAEIIARLESSLAATPDPITAALLAEFGHWLAAKKTTLAGQ